MQLNLFEPQPHIVSLSTAEAKIFDLKKKKKREHLKERKRKSQIMSLGIRRE